MSTPSQFSGNESNLIPPGGTYPLTLCVCMRYPLEPMNQWVLLAYLWARAHRYWIVSHWQERRCSCPRASPWHFAQWEHLTSTCSLTPRCRPAGRSWPFVPRDTCEPENEKKGRNRKSMVKNRHFIGVRQKGGSCYSYTYQKTYNGLSVARFSLHSSRSVDPSSICKSGASRISATASGEWREDEKRRDVS